MERKVMFRAWDGTDMYTFDTHKYDLIYNDISGWNVAPNLPNYKGEWTAGESSKTGLLFKLMQFSGLNDKHNFPIYEGDIIGVQRKEDYIHVVCKFGTIQREMATGFLVDITGFYFERPDGTQTFPIIKNYLGKHDLEIFEVLGNIYENPELLKA